MDDHPTSPLRKVSLPTFASSVPVEFGALPASTRTSFTRVENNTRPGTAAGDNDDPGDEAVPESSDRDGAPQLEQVVEPAAATVVVPQVPQTLVQFLLVSGRRRAMAFDPETTVGRVKELAWNTWPCGTSHASLPFPSPPPSVFIFVSSYSHTYARLPLLFATGPGAP